MNFLEIAPGAAVFLDANTLVYHFASEPTYGAACTELVKRVEQSRLRGFISKGTKKGTQLLFVPFSFTKQRSRPAR
jgi:hypothetical protein